MAAHPIIITTRTKWIETFTNCPQLLKSVIIIVVMTITISATISISTAGTTRNTVSDATANTNTTNIMPRVARRG